jgi:diguanylate cyclase (GGDEF)-like protein/PAS domain S-box-containing protein
MSSRQTPHGDPAAPKAAADPAQRLEIVLESISDGLLAVDAEWRIDLINSRAADMLGEPRQLLLGRDFREAVEIAVIEAVRHVMERRQPMSFEHFANAAGRWLDYRLSPSPDGGAVVFFVDITERKLAAERALLVAQHDALTGLSNRRLLREEAERILAAARRQAHKIAVLFLDLDRFKPINDSHGHEVGDKLLKTVARRIQRTLRAEDAVGRIGGDEFVAVLVGIRDAEDAAHVAANLVRTVGRPYRVNGLSLDVGVSVGISLFPEHGESIDVLFKRADAAMYDAKRSGRARFAFFSHGGAADAPPAEQTLAERMRAALANGAFSLDFQPVFGSADADVVAAEALIRWRQPDGSQVAPREFLPVAESTGLIKPIGDWLLREACDQHMKWIAQGFGEITVGVTISGAQFRQPDFARRVAEIVAHSGIHPAQLLLNVSEDTITGNVEESIPVLKDLHDIGVGVAMKNFGAGESNLRALSRLPVDKLRVDRSVLHRDGGRGNGNGNGHAVADAVIGLGQSLHREVIAEGVEDEADMEYLRARGVEYCQGFLLAAPMPAAEFAEWWRRRQQEGRPPPRLRVSEVAVAQAPGT